MSEPNRQGAMAGLVRLERIVPVPSALIGVKSGFRVRGDLPVACVKCGTSLAAGEIVTTSRGRPGQPSGAVCADCVPIACRVTDLALDQPAKPDPQLWRSRYR